MSLKQLKIEFQGIGRMSLYFFTQLHKSDKAYVYQLEDELGNKHYEVFKHTENPRFGCVSYPGETSFGISAWCIKTLPRAIEKFNELNDKE